MARLRLKDSGGFSARQTIFLEKIVPEPEKGVKVMKRAFMWLVIAIMTTAGINSALADEVPPSEKTNVGYDGGFFIRSDDGDFELKINGRVQPMIYLEKTTGAASNWSFKMRRALLSFSANIAQKVDLSLILVHSTSSSKFQTLNLALATAAYTVDPAFVVTAGTVGIPLSIIGDTSSSSLLMFDPPLVVTQSDGGKITPARSEFGNPDGLGLNFAGDIGKFYYSLSVVNGAAEPKAAIQDANGNTLVDASGGVESNYDLNFNKRVSLGARLAWHILDPVPGSETDLGYSEKPKLTVNVGGDYQGTRTDPTSNVVVSRILTGSAGAAFRWRGLSLNAEAFGRKTKLDNPGTTTWFSMDMDDLGYYVDGGYFIVPKKLEVAAVGSQIFREGPDNDSYQLGSGINWYLKDNDLKLQVAYTLTVDYDDLTGTQNSKAHFVGAMFSAKF